MSGSKTNKFFNYLANKIAPPGYDPGQLYAGAGYPYAAPQYAAPAFDPTQIMSSLGAQYTGATATGNSRQHNGNHIQGDDYRTHASDQAQLYNGNVYYGPCRSNCRLEFSLLISAQPTHTITTINTKPQQQLANSRPAVHLPLQAPLPQHLVSAHDLIYRPAKKA